MKKLALTIAIVLGLSMASFADGGGWFNQGQTTSTENTSNTSTPDYHRDSPGFPGHGGEGNQPAPLGSGIAVLMGLGAAYLVGKKRKEE